MYELKEKTKDLFVSILIQISSSLKFVLFYVQVILSKRNYSIKI